MQILGVSKLYNGLTCFRACTYMNIQVRQDLWAQGILVLVISERSTTQLNDQTAGKQHVSQTRLQAIKRAGKHTHVNTSDVKCNIWYSMQCSKSHLPEQNCKAISTFARWHTYNTRQLLQLIHGIRRIGGPVCWGAVGLNGDNSWGVIQSQLRIHAR